MNHAPLSHSTYQPAVNWFLTFTNAEGADFPRSFYRVVMWEIQPDATVVGLISEPRAGRGKSTTPTLKRPGSNPDAQYVHWDDLTRAERAQIEDSAIFRSLAT